MEPTTKLMVAGGKLVLREAFRRLKERREAILVQRAEELMCELAIAAELKSADEVGKILDEAPDDAVELFFEFAEQYARAVDPAVRPYLAKLAAPRLVHGQPIDPYFRRVGAMLISIDSTDLRRLVQLMEAVDQHAGEKVRSRSTYGVEVSASAATIKVRIDAGGGFREVDVSDGLATLALLHGARLVEDAQAKVDGPSFRWTHDRVEYLKGLLELFATKR